MRVSPRGHRPATFAPGTVALLAAIGVLAVVLVLVGAEGLALARPGGGGSYSSGSSSSSSSSSGGGGGIADFFFDLLLQLVFAIFAALFEALPWQAQVALVTFVVVVALLARYSAWRAQSWTSSEPSSIEPPSSEPPSIEPPSPPTAATSPDPTAPRDDGAPIKPAPP
jgi:hypothetical protein